MKIRPELVVDGKPNETLWRFMDVSKFLDLILHKNLVFPRFDKFEDTYEGYSANFLELVKKALIKKVCQMRGLIQE